MLTLMAIFALGTVSTALAFDNSDTTGPSVSFDRDVYPVPFGSISDFEDVASFSPDGRSLFPVHFTSIAPDKMQEEHTLGTGDLTIYIRIYDPNFDVSSQEIDKIAQDMNNTTVGPLKISVSRDSQTMVLAYAGGSTPNENGLIDVGDDDPENARQLGSISELAPDAGLFELDFTVRYTDGPSNSRCPATAVFTSLNSEMLQGNEGSRFDAGSPEKEDYCIMKGDVLIVEYSRLDASGNIIEILTDSATFDLRDGLLKSHDLTHVIGHDIILTLTDPDLDLDNDKLETYSLDLIEWDSDAARVTLGILGGEESSFDPKPTEFRETGDSTGIFQVVIDTPQSLQGNKLETGEEVILEYTDWGPSGADYVGQEDEDITWIVHILEITENTGTIEWRYDDGADYSSGGLGIVKLVDSTLNVNPKQIDITTAYAWSGADRYEKITIDMVETGENTGIFYGNVAFTNTDEPSSPLAVKVSRGNTVTVSYDGSTHHDSTIIVAKKPMQMSPLQQIKQGTPIKEVSCIDDNQHKLFIKDGTKPLCIKQETYDMLVLRGYF